MFTYEETKKKANDTLFDGLMCLALAQDHEQRRKVARTMIKSLELVIMMEDGQEAYEKGDTMGLIEALKKSSEFSVI